MPQLDRRTWLDQSLHGKRGANWRNDSGPIISQLETYLTVNALTSLAESCSFPSHCLQSS